MARQGLVTAADHWETLVSVEHLSSAVAAAALSVPQLTVLVVLLQISARQVAESVEHFLPRLM